MTNKKPSPIGEGGMDVIYQNQTLCVSFIVLHTPRFTDSAIMHYYFLTVTVFYFRFYKTCCFVEYQNNYRVFVKA